MDKIKKIYLDIDDTINSFIEHFLDYLNFEDRSLPTDWYDSRFQRLNEVEKDYDFWTTIPPAVNAELLHSFQFEGYCTARSIPTAWTDIWLRLNHFPPKHVISVGFGGNKVKHLKNVQCDIMLDDNINNFLSLNEGGIICYLLTRKHNESFDAGDLRVNSIEEFINKMKNDH